MSTRPVPHIQHTKALEEAAVAVTCARSSDGGPVLLCANPLDVNLVRESLSGVADWFKDPHFFFDGQPAGAELVAVENLILLATLLREHLRAGNVT